MAPVIAPLYHEEISANKNYIWNARVLSAKPPYRVTWTSTLYGSKPKKTTQTTTTLSRGKYRNWSWVVRATPAVAASWHVWKIRAAKLPKVKSSSIPPTPGWITGMKRLYALTTYLLGTMPLPLHVNILLVPHGQAYQTRVTLNAPNHVPLALASWYPASTAATSNLQEKRFHDLREALAVTGGMLEHVELAAGVTAAPPAGKARTIKAEANSFCWNFAASPALAVGTPYKIRSASGISSNVVENFAATYKRYPKDPAVKAFYAGMLLVHSMNRFLQQQHIPWPKHGGDVRGINALLGYCHAFLHYAGDVRNHPLPLKNIQPAHFFPVSERTSSQ
jgi:hypothetical protein